MKIILRTNLNLFIIIGILFVSCKHDKSSFRTSKSEIRNLIFNDEIQSTFIKNWDLVLCYENDQTRRYCYNDSIIQFEILKDQGYILSINGLKFLEFEKLISNMKNKYEHFNVKDLQTYQELSKKYNLVYGSVFKSSEFEIVIMSHLKNDLEFYTIVAHKL